MYGRISELFFFLSRKLWLHFVTKHMYTDCSRTQRVCCSVLMCLRSLHNKIFKFHLYWQKWVENSTPDVASSGQSRVASRLREVILFFHSALVRPHLEWTAQFWALFYRMQIDKLEQVKGNENECHKTKVWEVGLFSLEKGRLREILQRYISTLWEKKRWRQALVSVFQWQDKRKLLANWKTT